MINSCVWGCLQVTNGVLLQCLHQNIFAIHLGWVGFENQFNFITTIGAVFCVSIWITAFSLSIHFTVALGIFRFFWRRHDGSCSLRRFACWACLWWNRRRSTASWWRIWWLTRRFTLTRWNVSSSVSVLRVAGFVLTFTYPLWSILRLEFNTFSDWVHQSLLWVAFVEFRKDFLLMLLVFITTWVNFLKNGKTVPLQIEIINSVAYITEIRQSKFGSGRSDLFDTNFFRQVGHSLFPERKAVIMQSLQKRCRHSFVVIVFFSMSRQIGHLWREKFVCLWRASLLILNLIFTSIQNEGNAAKLRFPCYLWSLPVVFDEAHTGKDPRFCFVSAAPSFMPLF